MDLRFDFNKINVFYSRIFCNKKQFHIFKTCIEFRILNFCSRWFLRCWSFTAFLHKMERKADVKEIVNEALAYESLSRSRALSTPSFSASPVPGNQGGQRQTDRSFRPVSNDERRTSSARYRRYPPPTKRRDRQTRGTSYARAERLRNRRRESSVFDRLGASRRNGRHYHGTRHFHRRRHKPYDSFARTEDNLSVKGPVFLQKRETF